MVIRLLIPLFLLIINHSVWAFDTLTASVDKNPVQVGEYFTLTIEANGNVSGAQPDTSTLAKQFVVGPVSVGSHTSIINGSMTSQTTWQMQVLARSEGTFTIPSFTVNGNSSSPITLNVVARSKDNTDQKDIFIKTALKPESLYVQQASLYTVKLYIGKDLLEAQLTPPAMSGGQVTQMGQQSKEYEVINGRRYMVITKEYLIQPQKSGSFTIEAPVFNGQIRHNYRRMAVSAIADPLTIEVKPLPNDYSGDWLPGEFVDLSEEWQPSDSEVTVGTPITRTLTLTAVGITKEQLPDITMEAISGIRSYPDESDRKQLVRDGRVISQLVTSFALVPQTPGTYTLPEMSIPWFNTVTKRVEYATLPAKTITVIADENQIATPNVPVQITPPTIASTPDTIASIPAATSPVSKKTQYDWLVLTSGYLLWIGTLIIWFIRRNKTQVVEDTSTDKSSEVTLKDLHKAAKLGDNSQFYFELRQYITCQEPTLRLDTWLNQLEEAKIVVEVKKLQASLYSNHSQYVDLNALYSLIEQNQKKKTSKDDKHLTQLY
jgi:hypothetical protein